jgi:hypothetical protein
MLSHQRLRTAAAIALALSAVAAPAASARPLSPDPVYGAGTTAPTIVRLNPPSNPGFAWGDAAIGAAGGLALSMLAIGGILAMSQHRAHRWSASAGRAGRRSTLNHTRPAPTP